MARSQFPPPRRRVSRRRRLTRRALPVLVIVIFLAAGLVHLLVGGSSAKTPSAGQHPNQAVGTSHSPTSPGPSTSTSTPPSQPTSQPGTTVPAGFTATVTSRLTQQISAYLKTRNLSAAVGVLDLKTGATFCTGCHQHFVTASIAKVDILETALLQAQQAHTTLTVDQQQLATTMIENSDNDSASALYDSDGANTGIEAANKTLGLKDTTVGANGLWGDTRTTVTDQLVLLKNLELSGGPLTAASRRYEIHLMSNVESDQQWGVPAAAVKGQNFIVKNGWLPRGEDGDEDASDNANWSVNSDGVLTGGGHDPIAVCVLSDHGPTMPYGITTDQHLARLVTRPLIHT